MLPLFRKTGWASLGILALFWSSCPTTAQIDPAKRRLIQFGYNAPLQGHAPIAAYGFFYYNQPNSPWTNVTLRAAIAPVYIDSELGFSKLLGPHTDFSIGVAGGGFADSYSEIRMGKYLHEESFTGHGGEFALSVYHLLNPNRLIPLWVVARATLHPSFYVRDDDTAPGFAIPEDMTTFQTRVGLRLGGKEPSLTDPLAMELSVWWDGQFRTPSDAYGYFGDRSVESVSHLFWSRALLKYTWDESQRVVEASLTAGDTSNADRFSAYRLGGLLPLAQEFPLNIPGYYFQELSAKRFALFNLQFSIPIDPAKNWRFTFYGASGVVDYVSGLEQAGKWHTGLGGGFTYRSPSGSWQAMLSYGHGFDAIRTHGRGADSIGILFQYDFEASKDTRWYSPAGNPQRRRLLEILR